MRAEPKRISMEQLDRLSVDEENRLYWDGKEVVTTLSLPRSVNIAIIAAAVAAAIAALWPIVRFFVYHS